MNKKTRLIVVTVIFVISNLMSACGLIEGTLNAGANANGDGNVDTKPCAGIVC